MDLADLGDTNDDGDELEEPFDGATVVVTHHAPHSGSLTPRYANEWSSAWFINELPGEFFKVAAPLVTTVRHSVMPAKTQQFWLRVIRFIRRPVH